MLYIVRLILTVIYCILVCIFGSIYCLFSPRNPKHDRPGREDAGQCSIVFKYQVVVLGAKTLFYGDAAPD